MKVKSYRLNKYISSKESNLIKLIYIIEKGEELQLSRHELNEYKIEIQEELNEQLNNENYLVDLTKTTDENLYKSKQQGIIKYTY